MKGGKDRIEKYNIITEKKMNTSIESLCSNLPSNLSFNNHFKVEYALFYNYCRCLEFAQAPDYGYLWRLLRDLIYKESFKHQIMFQWITTTGTNNKK